MERSEIRQAKKDAVVRMSDAIGVGADEAGLILDKANKGGEFHDYGDVYHFLIWMVITSSEYWKL